MDGLGPRSGIKAMARNETRPGGRMDASWDINADKAANMMVNDQEHTNQDGSYSRSRSALNFDSDGPIFSLYDGTVRGTVDNSTGALQFFGLPYAEPPTDSNRFRPPIVSFLCKNT